MQLTNNYDKWAFNGDVGIVVEVAPKSGKLLVNFGGDENVQYEREELEQLRHSYATAIHKSQGSEYQTVIMVVTKQHSLMLQRNLLYTGLTRAKKKAIIIGDADALKFGIQNVSNRSRNSGLKFKMQKYAQ
jgi:exodeoxyribonuclease V alpha subunit